VSGASLVRSDATAIPLGDNTVDLIGRYYSKYGSWTWPRPTTKETPMSEIDSQPGAYDHIDPTGANTYANLVVAGGDSSRRPRIEIYPHQVAEGADPEWGWRLKAGNGEIVAQGEGYTKADAAEAMARKIVVDNAYADARVLVLNWSGHEIEERTPTVHVTDGRTCRTRQ
jgi:uncharacterized protein YegP (UPF0339 family)